jgi:hypothetical protein
MTQAMSAMRTTQIAKAYAKRSGTPPGVGGRLKSDRMG